MSYSVACRRQGLVYRVWLFVFLLIFVLLSAGASQSSEKDCAAKLRGDLLRLADVNEFDAKVSILDGVRVVHQPTGPSLKFSPGKFWNDLAAVEQAYGMTVDWSGNVYPLTGRAQAILGVRWAEPKVLLSRAQGKYNLIVSGWKCGVPSTTSSDQITTASRECFVLLQYLPVGNHVLSARWCPAMNGQAKWGEPCLGRLELGTIPSTAVSQLGGRLEVLEEQASQEVALDIQDSAHVTLPKGSSIRGTLSFLSKSAEQFKIGDHKHTTYTIKILLTGPYDEKARWWLEDWRIAGTNGEVREAGHSVAMSARDTEQGGRQYSLYLFDQVPSKFVPSRIFVEVPTRIKSVTLEISKMLPVQDSARGVGSNGPDKGSPLSPRAGK